MLERLRPLARRWTTPLVALLAGLLAATLRLPWLASSPPGFSLAEAWAALAARDHPASDWLLPNVGPLDTQEPVFTALLWMTGTLAGWGVDGARLAAALSGIIAAVACALWYRRALGPLAGVIGGTLIAVEFPWLILSRQAQPAITAATLAAVGLWCLWEGLGPARPDDRSTPSANRGWWVIAAAIAFGLGFSAHPTMLPALVIVPLIAAILYWHPDTGPSRPAPSWLLGSLACLLLLATPVAIQAITSPDDFRDRIEQDWDGNGLPDRLAGPIETLNGYGETLLSITWTGHDTATLGGPDRPLLDPLLLLWSIAGLLALVARPRNPLHQVAALWLLGFSLPAALLDPGNPALLAPALPVLTLLPLLGVDAAIAIAQRHRPASIGPTKIVIGVTLVGSLVWSLIAYRDWTDSDTTYHAFDAGLRDALAAVDDLAPGSAPVYIATTPAKAPLLDYLGPTGEHDRIQRAIDHRNTLVVPADGVGYIVTTDAEPLPADLRRLLEGQQPVESGTTPSGNPGWQLWIAGHDVRDGLPWTLPALSFTDGFNLAGFDIQPDLGDVATTGRLPDPPRVIVTLVWDVPRGATPHIARVRLVPTESASGIPEEDATLAEAWLTTSPPIAAGNRGRELVIVRMSIPVPESPDLIVEVQAGLTRADGTVQIPTNGGPSSAGDYVILNRVQYVPNSTTP